MVKLVVVFPLAPLCLSASMLISGDNPLGMLADATMAIPPNPNGDPVPMMRKSAQSSWSGTMTVEGGTGSGFLEFEVEAMATSFSGSWSSEYMQSYSALTAPFQVYSPGWLPQGSTAAGCYCYLPFTFGVPQRVTFSGDAYSSYEFYPTIPGVPPYLAGNTIRSYTSLGIMGVDDSHFQPLFQGVNAVFSQDSSVPEPRSVWFVATGLLALLLLRARRLKNSTEPVVSLSPQVRIGPAESS
jgi:hypothetical protein